MRTSTSRRRLGRAYALGLGWVVMLAISLALLTPALMDIYFALALENLGLQTTITMGIALALATTAATITAWLTRSPRQSTVASTRSAAAKATAGANA